MAQAQRNHALTLRDGKVINPGRGHGAARFATAKRLTEHHDKELADLTGELNTLFMRHLTHTDGRELVIVPTPDGYFLVWAQPEDRDGGAEPHDGDDEAVRQTLGLA